MRMIICAYCGKEFPYDGTRSHKKYCSLKCVASAPRPQRKLGKYLTCPICGGVFYRQASRIRGKVNYCSRKCMGVAFHLLQLGDLNTHWRGGKVDYQWYGQNWRRQSRKARQRDNHTCQRCNMTEAELGRVLDVHHIKPYNSFNNPERANRLKNLTSLCRSCHTLIENTIEQKAQPRFTHLPFPSQ